jgi:radical SAM superfamily enzyme YgiQ (UPF0313 family)
MKPKILFINANEESSTDLPLGLGYLVSSLREEFGRNSMKFKIVNQNIEEEINNFKPHIVGITSTTKNYGKAINYAEIAKKHGLLVIIGGVHISTLPLSMTNNMDIAVIGEGERTIIELFNIFEKHENFENDTLKKIDGIAFRNNGKFIQTKRRAPIEPLDKIPFPARDLFNIGSSTHILTSRGCPFNCVFCSTSHFWGSVRFFSADYVANEIKYLVERYKVKDILIFDDLFTFNKERIRKITELLKREDILNKVTFYCNARANMIDGEMVVLLRRMNVRSVVMGLESGCPSTLKYLKADTLTIKDSLNAIKLLKKYAIRYGASFIIGSPKETEKDILTTLEFIRDAKIDNFDVFILTPFPATPLWGYAKKRKLVDDKDMDWSTLDITSINDFDKAVILSENISREKLSKIFWDLKTLSRKRRIIYMTKLGLRNLNKISIKTFKTFFERISLPYSGNSDKNNNKAL